MHGDFWVAIYAPSSLLVDPMLEPLSKIPNGSVDPRVASPGDVEWLETDGLGGFACNNVAMCAGRRYHGLLTAPLPGTALRHLFLAAFVETVVEPEVSRELSGPRQGGAPAARLPEEFVSFELAPWPTTRFAWSGGSLCREILMPRGRHAVFVRYTAGDAPVSLRLQPLVAFREADHQTFQNDVLRREVESIPGGVRLQCYDSLPAMALTHAGSSCEFRPEPGWREGVEYRMELARGYGGHEDLFAPGEFVVDLSAGGSITFAATIDGVVAAPAEGFVRAASARRAQGPEVLDLQSRCALAADDFLYVGPGGRTGILAGFPWFVEWGRDTFLSLPGLSLARGRLDLCETVLTGALEYLQDGLLPNIFAGTKADSHYGSVDASLWFARAVLLFQRAGGSESLVRETYLPALIEIAECYAEGTAEAMVAMGIREDEGGLIRAGTPELNPTWMDAKPESGAVTPRHGCPVEIAGLWFSLLRHLAELDPSDKRWQAAADRAGATFLERFWLEEERSLADVWRPAETDRSVRPNMVLAAGLEFSPLTREQRAAVFARARAELLTPVGLRTLAPDHPEFVPVYTGDTESRDRAYHQGTVWPWLLGAYVETGLRADPANRDHLREVIDGLAGELDHGGLEHLNEVYDGDPPHRRGGTFAQAWSTAEVLRALALLDGRMPL